MINVGWAVHLTWAVEWLVKDMLLVSVAMNIVGE